MSNLTDNAKSIIRHHVRCSVNRKRDLGMITNMVCRDWGWRYEVQQYVEEQYRLYRAELEAGPLSEAATIEVTIDILMTPAQIKFPVSREDWLSLSDSERDHLCQQQMLAAVKWSWKTSKESKV